jgi:parafibromin
MISPSSTALITMHNVKDFLQDSKFIPSDQAKLLASSKEGGNSGGGYLAEDVVQINHARANTGGVGIGGGKTIETRQARYFIVDSVEALAKFGGPGKEEEAWYVSLPCSVTLSLVVIDRD